MAFITPPLQPETSEAREAARAQNLKVNNALSVGFLGFSLDLDLSIIKSGPTRPPVN